MWEMSFLVHIKTIKFVFPILSVAGIGEDSIVKEALLVHGAPSP